MPREVPKTCATCGYLAVRHSQTRQLVETEQLLRDTGQIPTVHIDALRQVPAYDDYPICFLCKINFREWIGNPPNDAKRKHQVIHEKTCADHVQWQQGFTPREHLEMILESERLKWQAEREQADRDFRAEQARLADTRHKDNIELTARLHKESQGGEWRRMIAAAALGAFLASLGWGFTQFLANHDSRPQQPASQHDPAASP